MANLQPQPRSDIGMVGVWVMGRNLVLNMADHGFSVAMDKATATINDMATAGPVNLP